MARKAKVDRRHLVAKLIHADGYTVRFEHAEHGIHNLLNAFATLEAAKRAIEGLKADSTPLGYNSLSGAIFVVFNSDGEVVYGA